ncbi:MAG: hypothetical protein J6Y80_03440 [Victivallales bacterium]|nr:hypothetical protein [Victivallales bacterium]
MAFGQKKEDTNVAAAPLAAAPTATRPLPPAVPRGGSSSGLGVDGICLIVGSVALLAAIGSLFYVMKALFVF